MADTNNQQKIGMIISRLTVAIQNAGMYPDDHPQVVSNTQEAYDLLSLLLKDVPEVNILMIDEYFIANNKSLLIPVFYETAFIRFMKKKGVEWISFFSGLPFAQFKELIRSFASSGRSFMKSTRYLKLGEIKLKESGKIRIAEKPYLEESGNYMVNVLDLQLLSK
jgi:hypothetical protein